MRGPLLLLGVGYSVRPLAEEWARAGEWVLGTTRSEEKAEGLKASGIEPIVWAAGEALPDAVRGARVVIASVSPDAEGCPAARALAAHATAMEAKALYLSSSGVYGDFGGEWVDEETPCQPTDDRGEKRLRAEADWQGLGLPVTLCRLAGIYGPGRSAIDSLTGNTRGARSGLSRRVIKEGQVFNRIHRDDIVRGLSALIGAGEPPGIVTFADDLPSPPQDVIEYAARLLGIEPPPEVPFEEAELSPMARSFYADNKRLKNDRLKGLVGDLLHPSYREGLEAILKGRQA